MARQTRMGAALAAVALTAALAVPAARAATLVASQAGGQQLQVTASGQQLEVDLQLNSFGSASFTVALEAADVGQWLRLNAVVGNAIGEPLPGLQLSLGGASFALVGTVTPQFGLLAGVDGDALQQTLRFEPAESGGFELGDPFGRAGAVDWLVVGDGAAAGDTFTITLSAVPEPSALALLATGLAVLGLRRRYSVR